MQFACAIFSSVACPAFNIFRHYFINGTTLEKKKLLKVNVCFDFLYNVSLYKFLVIRRTERDMMNNLYWSSC